MPSILSIFGTRPEAIKMAPLVSILKQTPGLQSEVAVTAQHREMLDQVLAQFGIRPAYDLDLMHPGQSLTAITGRVLAGLEKVLARAKPDLVLVHGDTTTTFAAALAAFYRHCPVGHVEAGLRSGRKDSPYPEEINRRLAAVLTDLHFAPTAGAETNLLREGVPPGQIFVTGNTAIDTLRMTVRDHFHFAEPQLQALDFSRPVLLAEVHRRENWGSPLEEICTALKELVLHYGFPLVFPVHRNPIVRKRVFKILGDTPGALLLDPLDPRSFHNLLARCHLVLTDSGGVQEEAPSLGRPVLVLREVTERPEAVAAGTVRLAGTTRETIDRAARELLENPRAYAAMARSINPYGDGRAAERIRDAILYHFDLRPKRPHRFNPGRDHPLEKPASP